MDDNTQLTLIHGSGRSGTSWLAELLRNSDAVYYKNEPFSPRHKTPYNAWVHNLDDMENDLARHLFYKLVAEFEHDLDVPPFAEFNKIENSFATFFHKLGYKVPATSRLFPLVTQHSFEHPILIKDVWLPGKYISRITELFGGPVISIVRNPLAAISSALRGESKGIFAPRQAVEERVRELHKLQTDFDDPSGLTNDISGLDRTLLETLRWRLEAEPSAAFAESYKNGKVVVFEDLAKNTDNLLLELFEFLNWNNAVVPKTDSPKSDSSQRPESSDTKSEVNDFYSTNRSAEQALTGWQSFLDHKQQETILKEVANSPLTTLWDF